MCCQCHKHMHLLDHNMQSHLRNRAQSTCNSLRLVKSNCTSEAPGNWLVARSTSVLYASLSTPVSGYRDANPLIVSVVASVHRPVLIQYATRYVKISGLGSLRHLIGEKPVHPFIFQMPVYRWKCVHVNLNVVWPGLHLHQHLTGCQES